jgi:hypothetical protein
MTQGVKGKVIGGDVDERSRSMTRDPVTHEQQPANYGSFLRRFKRA